MACLTREHIQSSKHRLSKAVSFLLAAKIETVHLSTVAPLMERRRRLVVLEAFHDCTVYHHLHSNSSV